MENIENAPKKAGMVAIVGRSNVGKSTLINSLVGTKIAIITPKPQTTRDVIHGVVNDPRAQIVFVDTPGIYTHIPDRLTAKLNEKARDAMDGIDALLYVVDPTRHVGDEETAVHRMVKEVKAPKIMIINKDDQKGTYIDEYLAWSDEFTKVIRISALQNRGVKELIDTLVELMPEGEALYPGDQISNIENKFWLEELIREKVFMGVHEEVPYSTAVRVEETSRRPDGTVYIKAYVLTSSQRYKKMLIGKGATKIRGIGAAARREMEAVTNDKVYLDLEVKVEERWSEQFE